ncbi:putative RNA methyltransferase [Halomonas elongata]|uniref:23S rRNA (Guanine(745)-N(1))-methyltransferase RlmA n=1 Tax=Halomonas elongata (strain ATCC 33173 / DSM 2581 / NBRC 15536 / NCIMB 2198 / 1H9) TaxID=768066 RepID=E1V7G6_HALED|nr:methyltransferase domain-containing protein [Halomonas elongata]WBF18754.1 methyltransferase domain-containing protein [Halomonas elongata]WPU47610.1 methyltransferase domain-containing protein [Halomonas elongata DSM 2581]CBV41516.1 23S rRNA (guanine(745)-N(1))-methyltransferase RlmA [Halomonas elongata DSM 2581]
MSTTPFGALACPLDGDPLGKSDRVWRCAAGHSFDIARQGHVNLLPVQNKRSRDPGDSKEMVTARRRFLEAGHYQPIAEAVSRAVLADAPAGASLSCLDAGCGEGYYLRELARACEEAVGDERSLALLGVDISKWAILAAAKQWKGATWAVGTNAHLPVQANSLDRVLCLFGFPVYPEFARVLKPGGELLQVDAGPDHLRELREIIYPTLKPPRADDEKLPEGFTLLGSETLRESIELSGPEPIADLLAMTPHLHRASAEGRARVASLTSLRLTVDVRLTRWKPEDVA